MDEIVDIEPDYEFLGKCQAWNGEPDFPGRHNDCGEPIIARVWWNDYDKDYLLVCAKHFEQITGHPAS